MEPNLEDVFVNDDLVVRCLRGTAPRLVVAFTGIGHEKGLIQKEEFYGASSGGGENTVLFVTDRHRSWFSRSGIKENIVSVIRDHTRSIEAEHVATIGNSMGGHGALLFADAVGADVALAFAPQYTMDRRVIDEERWSAFHPAFDPAGLRVLDSAKLESDPVLRPDRERMPAHPRRYAIYGWKSREDRVHAKALAAASRARVIALKGAAHEISVDLKASGALAPIIAAAMAGDDATLDALTVERRITI